MPSLVERLQAIQHAIAVVRSWSYSRADHLIIADALDAVDGLLGASAVEDERWWNEEVERLRRLDPTLIVQAPDAPSAG